MKKVLAVAMAAAFTLSSMPAFAQGMSLGGPRTMGSPKVVQGGGDLLRPRGGGGGRGGWQGGGGRQYSGGGARYGWRGEGRGRRGGYGVGAGLAGLAAGAVIGGALASRPYYGDPGYGYDDSGYGYGAPTYGYDSGYDVVDVAPSAPAGGDATAYCISRFKSYDPASGTYLGYDGLRHPCP